MNGHFEQSGITLHAPVMGTYFDGVTSKPWKVQVTVEWSQLRLRFEEQFNLGRELHLPVEGIQRIELLSKGRFLLNFGTDTNASLEVDDPQLLAKIDLHSGRKRLPGKLDIWSQTIGWGRLAVVALLVAASVAGLYLWALPAVSQFAAGHIPAAAEKKIGGLLIDKILNNEDIDTAGSEILRSFCQELGFSGKFPLDPVLVIKKTANAFAVPGGHIVVYDSIFGLMKGYETLAALLAHEYAHVESHHTIKMLARSIASYAFVSVLFGDFSGITATLIDNANMLQNLHYQRGMEREADLKGAGMLAERGIDPNGMVKLLEGLQPLAGLPRYLGWASTHPDMEDRVTVTKKHSLTVKWTKGNNDQLNELWVKLKKNRTVNAVKADSLIKTCKNVGKK